MCREQHENDLRVAEKMLKIVRHTKMFIINHAEAFRLLSRPEWYLITAFCRTLFTMTWNALEPMLPTRFCSMLLFRQKFYTFLAYKHVCYVIISMCCCLNLLLLLLWLFCCWNWKVKCVLMKFRHCSVKYCSASGANNRKTAATIYLYTHPLSLLAHITAATGAHNHNRSIEWLFYNFLWSVTSSHIIYNLLYDRRQTRHKTYACTDAGAIISKYIYAHIYTNGIWWRLLPCSAWQ